MSVHNIWLELLLGLHFLLVFLLFSYVFAVFLGYLGYFLVFTICGVCLVLSFVVLFPIKIQTDAKKARD
ncbi:nitrite extrusion protein 2 [Helicobacter pylori India7]|uniref:Nitrite extrusion protein 2 n=1 Tax=Helicobacter pylori (strain India7) TaxID=907238 RepID=E8QE43_HELP7|nr:nitrite extrusion protein 2 [Helicobacter pylori India7]